MRRLAGAVSVILAAVVAVLASNWIEQVTHPAAPLPGLVVLAEAPPEVGGFDRECGRGHACVFGPRWTDDVDVDGGHDGCDTRNGILRAQLQDVVIRPGTHGCVVAAGTLTDPYSGETVSLDQVQIDHVFPLAQAWSRGASGWTLQQRKNFANDPRNLVATTNVVNRAKSDHMPDEWTPPAVGRRCFYATRFVEVARAYQLVVTRAEDSALTRMLASCSTSERK
jgi:hypothetical protein